MNSTVIPEAELQATDPDKDSVLFYTLQEVTPVSGTPALANTGPWLLSHGLLTPRGSAVDPLPRVLAASSPFGA